MIVEILETLEEAARTRRACKLKLRNDPSERLVHPYGVCLSSRKKNMIVVWQMEGPPTKSPMPGYRNLLLKDCESVEMTETHFLVQKDFDVKDPIYKKWLFHV